MKTYLIKIEDKSIMDKLKKEEFIVGSYNPYTGQTDMHYPILSVLADGINAHEALANLIIKHKITSYHLMSIMKVE